MKWIISRYNHDLSYLPKYTNDYVIYDRSEQPLENSIKVPNIGSDIYDKFSFIIDNYDNLPDIALYTKANIFKYIRKDEFDEVKDNQTFTPIFSKKHKEEIMDFTKHRKDAIAYVENNLVTPELKELFYKLNQIDNNPPEQKQFSFYDKNEMYNELNIPFYLSYHPVKSPDVIKPLMEKLGIWGKEYVKFAPGSNYILPKENILQHPKEFYEDLRSYLDWTVYPGEAMLIERGLYNIFK